MARFGIEPGDRGTLETQLIGNGAFQGVFVPMTVPEPGTQAAERAESSVVLFQADTAQGRLTIYPIDTRQWSSGFLGPKYSKITAIELAADVVEDVDARDALDSLPSGLTKDFEYGLGFASELDVIVKFVEANTDCTIIALVATGDIAVDGPRFKIPHRQFEHLRDEIRSIKRRGDHAIRRVKEAATNDALGASLGMPPKKLSLGRLPTTKWMTRVAAGEDPLSDDEQDALLAAASAGAPQMVASRPEMMIRLHQDIELVTLDQLISRFSAALENNHREDWWQKFFEQNLFAMQLIFGGPTVFIESQVPIGKEALSARGKKIADYLFKGGLTDNAALVEIKRPSTKLLKKREYRAGVYGVQSEIGEAVAQVLDQALQLTRYENETKVGKPDTSWASNAPRCFVVVGLASTLDSDSKKKSFDLYREHLSGVRLVTYDELLAQLTALRDFLVTTSPTEVQL